MSQFGNDIEAFRRAYPNAVLVDQKTGETIPADGDSAAEPVDRPDDGPGEMVQPGVMVEAGKLIIVVPAITRSEANEGKWVRKMQRKLTVKRAIREVLGPHHALLSPYAEAYHADKALCIVLRRLGGKRVDKTANLGPIMKVAEDVIAGALLADDGDPRWRSSVEQSPGGPCGVRIEIEIFE